MPKEFNFSELQKSNVKEQIEINLNSALAKIKLTKEDIKSSDNVSMLEKNASSSLINTEKTALFIFILQKKIDDEKNAEDAKESYKKTREMLISVFSLELRLKKTFDK